MRISEWMKPEFRREMAATRKLLARIPDDKLEWSPGDGLHTIGWNVGHLVDIAGWASGIIRQSEWDIAPTEAGDGRPPEKPDVARFLADFDANVASSLAAFDGVPDEVMAEPWSLKVGEHVLFTMPKGDCLRRWVFSHIAHHRGILSTYLRLARVPHDSIYESDWSE